MMKTSLIENNDQFENEDKVESFLFENDDRF